MSTVETCGSWQATAGSEEAVVEARTEFAGWASAAPGTDVRAKGGASAREPLERAG